MPLRRLTSLEQQNLQQEFDNLNQQITSLRRLLEDRKELLKSLKKDLRSLKRKYGDSRRTKISAVSDTPIKPEKLKTEENSKSKVQNSPPEPAILEFTQRGYVRRFSPNSKKPKTDHGLNENDFILKTETTSTEDDLFILNTGGKVYPVKVGEIPATTGRSPRGTPLITLLTSTAQANVEGIVSRFVMPEFHETTQMVLLTKQGRIKRLAMEELNNMSRRGITILKLKDNDELAFCEFTTIGQNLILASSGGRLLRFPVNDDQLPVMGRAAMGLQAFRILKNQQMVGCATVDKDDELLLVTQEGYAKRIPASNLRAANRGDLGIQTVKFHNKTDHLAAMVKVNPGKEVALLTSRERIVKIPVDTVPILARDSKGESIIDINRDEQIISVIEVQ
jgi:DNA gyrase subunit A